MKIRLSRGARGGGLFSPLTMATWAIALMVLFMGYPFLKTVLTPSTESFSPNPPPSYTPPSSDWKMSPGNWVIVSGVQYNIWDYREQVGPAQVLRAQVVTQQGSSQVVTDSNVRAEVLTLGLEVTSAELVSGVYGGIQTAAIAGTAFVQLTNTLKETSFPPDILASLDTLESMVSEGGDKAAPVVNAIAASGNSANALTSTHTDHAAEAYLDTMTVGSLPEGRLVAVFLVAQAAIHEGVPLGGWLSQFQTNLDNGTPALTALRDTYGEAVAVAL